MVPAQPKIYHIVHADRLASIIAEGCLWCDAEVIGRAPPGTSIGMGKIKHRRLDLPLDSHSELNVHRSHALRGNASGDAQRQETVGAERLKARLPRRAWEP